MPLTHHEVEDVNDMSDCEVSQNLLDASRALDKVFDPEKDIEKF